MDPLYAYSVSDGNGKTYLLGVFATPGDLQTYMRSVDHLIPPAMRRWRTIHSVPYGPPEGEIDEYLLATITGTDEEQDARRKERMGA
jgi:hypothetical protein